MMTHCDDDAELYALGMLDAQRSAHVEKHIEGCGACRARVIAAEASAAALATMLPPAAPARSGRRARAIAAVAAAAALIFASASTIESVALHGANARAARNDIALAAVASSHFRHATLTSAAGTAVKVLYARDGSWLYIVASGVAPGTHAILDAGGRRWNAGILDDARPATLFVTHGGRVRDVQLIAGDRVLARGTLVY